MQIFFFSKHQNKAEFKNRDDSEVLRSDFPGLCNLNDLYSLHNLSGLNDLNSLISLKSLLNLIVGSSLAHK